MSDYYESICKLYEKTMQRLEAKDYQGEDHRFLKGEAHAYFTAMQLSEFHSTPDKAAPVLTESELTSKQVEVLEMIETRFTKPLFSDALNEMLKRDYCKLVQPYEQPGPPYDLTEAGRAALRAHQASMEGTQTS